jgi:hypothetical protein
MHGLVALPLVKEVEWNVGLGERNEEAVPIGRADIRCFLRCYLAAVKLDRHHVASLRRMGPLSVAGVLQRHTLEC